MSSDSANKPVSVFDQVRADGYKAGRDDTLAYIAQRDMCRTDEDESRGYERAERGFRKALWHVRLTWFALGVVVNILSLAATGVIG